ncbi:MAG: type II and III secretion system protein [Treponema sp.]|nr:type II and III secretion system protein [Treponema sp.]
MKRFLFIIVAITFVYCPLFSQRNNEQIISFDFVDQNIREILFAFSSYARISIIGDDTVSGNASFQYNGFNFEQAFDSFLMANRLFSDKAANVWIVSRIKISMSENSIVLDSYDVTPSQLMDKLTQAAKTGILHDILPVSKTSLHLETATLQEAVELIMRPFSEYTVLAYGSYIQIKKIDPPPYMTGFTSEPALININEANGIYTVEAERARLTDVLDNLFLHSQREYLSFIRSDQILERAKFSGRELRETLGIILEQCGGEYREIDDLFYIFPRQQSEIISGLINEDKSWRRYETRYLLSGEIISFLQNRFGGLKTVSLPDTSAFLGFVNDEVNDQIIDYIKIIDLPRMTQPVRLKFIKTEDLFRSLPPSARREDLVDAGDGNTFFYTGSPEKRALFIKDLEIIDRPRPRIRYDLFIIQVQDSNTLDWSIEAQARPLRMGDRTMVSGQLGNLLNLNFDVISVFGYQFAAKLNAAISENQANVFADTTLFGLSGQDIKFQNTSTYRYRDYNTDPDTGKPVYTGITREIISGLMLEINGWVSGDGMITTTVKASVSKRGADVSSTIGNPPPTSEKILTTQVCARSGETVILSGLRQNDSAIVEQRIPLISKIPILGWLFRSKNNTYENTQMIIYLVPHLDLANEEYAIDGLKTASIYNRFIEPYLEEK